MRAAGFAKRAATALASGLYLSYLPARLFNTRIGTGAGLIGSFWGLVLSLGLPLDPHRQTAVWLGALLIAVAVSDLAEEALGRHDDPRIVIDEMIGYWTAILWLPRTPGVLIAAFVLFRIFDVGKWGWIRRAAKLPGGWGVVMDDVLAGIVSNGLLRLALAINPF